MAEFDSVTRDDLENRILRLMGPSPRQTTLAANASASTTTLTVTSADDISESSRLEIDEEQVLVEEVSGTTLTVIRGYSGTAPASHSSGDVVVVNPDYTKSNRVEAINVVLNNWLSLYLPRLEWDSSIGGTFLPNNDTYAAPADAINVLNVAWKEPGGTGLHPVMHGPLESFPTDIISTGRGYRIYSPNPPAWGYTVYAQFEMPYARLETGSQTIETDFPPHADELIVQGAVLYLLGWRLIPKVRIDETIFAREAGQAAPTNLNVQWVESMKQDWIASLQRVVTQRPIGASPRKVYVK